MPGDGTYLDLNVLINGVMDGFLLLLTGKLLHYPMQGMNVFFSALIGEIPVILAIFGASPWLAMSKVLTPILMVGVAFRPQNVRSFGRLFISFWLVSAGLGGFIYALWGWMQFGGWAGNVFSLALDNLWVLPLGGGLWWLSQKMWQRWQNYANHMERVLYDLEIDFGQSGKILRIKGLLDTGNDLRDPFTGVPIMLVEEQVASGAMTEELLNFLNLPWREAGDPWPILWKTDPFWLKRLVFIPYKGIGGENWLLGVRPERVNLINGEDKIPVKATVALVQQVLSNEGEYQALLHQEHVLKGAACT